MMRRVLTGLLLLAASCSEPHIPGGQIVLRNDVLDKTHNTFTVSGIVTDRGAVSHRRTLAPGDEYALPFKKVRAFSIAREYVDHAKLYKVRCPKSLNTRVLVKLIDVHTNRLGGGCETVKRGRREKGGYTKWE